MVTEVKCFTVHAPAIGEFDGNSNASSAAGLTLDVQAKATG